MVGNNEMKINEATMIEIVEYWLTNKFLNPHEPAPKVTAVSSNGMAEFTVYIQNAKANS